ncbi:MAG: ABC transporter permease [Ruminococcaceae bacterium]|nr:ABC transporter permease [Oscillospiraceae bacterium]
MREDNKASHRKVISDAINIKQIFLTVLAVYVFLIVSFFFLAGEQLLFRESRGDIPLQTADSGATELVQGVTVEQVFHARIQRFQGVSVQIGTSYRSNSGTVLVELLRQDSGELLMCETFDASSIDEGQVLSLTVEEPIETVYEVPLVLRLTADSMPGSAVTPLISTQTEKENFFLLVNGEIIPGMLCFSAEGTDNIWTGLHYWPISAGMGLLLSLLLLVVWFRWHYGKHSYIVNALVAMKKYRFLIQQLVNRDFKAKYKRSILGVFWSFLNPLLMMMVQYFVFSTIFKSDVPNFAAYLIIGTVMFNFFSESCSMTLGSILGNAGLITKVYMPKYIYPLTRTMSSMVNLVISLLPLMIVCLATGVQFRKATVLALYFFICLVIFCLGLGMLLATSMVFFRDTQFLWGVLSMMWMYATPIFYPEKILPDNLRLVLQINPLYHFLKNARMCILEGISPEPVIYFQCLMIAFAMLLVGAVVFYKNQDKFVLYL